MNKIKDFVPLSEPEALLRFLAELDALRMASKQEQRTWNRLTPTAKREKLVSRILRGSVFLHYDYLTSDGQSYTAVERKWWQGMAEKLEF